MTEREQIADEIEKRARELYHDFERCRTIDGFKNQARKYHYLSAELSNLAASIRKGDAA